MDMIQRDVQGVTVLDLVGRLTSSDGAGKLGGRVSTLVAEGRTKVVTEALALASLAIGVEA